MTDDRPPLPIGVQDEPEHATLSDGTVLRDLTWRELRGLHWDPVEGQSYTPDEIDLMQSPPTLPAGPDYPVTGNA